MKPFRVHVGVPEGKSLLAIMLEAQPLPELTRLYRAIKRTRCQVILFGGIAGYTYHLKRNAALTMMLEILCKKTP